MGLFWGTSALLLSSLASAANLTGTVFEKASQGHGKALYEWKRTEESVPPRKKITFVYSSLDGKDAVVEKAETEKNRVKKYSIQYFQTGNRGKMEVRGDKVHFEFTKNGETDTSEEDLPENLIVTATMVDYIVEHAEPLLKGETIPARMGILDRKETVGFKFFKVDEGKRDGKDTVTIKMKPTSFVVAAIVDPLFLTFQKDGMKLLEIVGRTMPKQLVDGKWKDLDADTLYNN